MLGTLLIRPYQPTDAPLLFEAATESVAEIFPWLPWCHSGYTRAESEEWIERCVETWEDRTEYNFAIVDQSGRFLGGCGLNQIRTDHRFANLGYWVRTSAARRGVASAAVRRLADFAFIETDLLRLEIVAAVENVASQRVAEKAGALREAVLQDRLLLHGKRHDAVLYALLRSRPR